MDKIKFSQNMSQLNIINNPSGLRFIAIGIPLNLIKKRKEQNKDISHMKEVTGFLGVYSCRYTLYTLLYSHYSQA